MTNCVHMWVEIMETEP